MRHPHMQPNMPAEPAPWHEGVKYRQGDELLVRPAGREPFRGVVVWVDWLDEHLTYLVAPLPLKWYRDHFEGSKWRVAGCLSDDDCEIPL